MKLFNETDIGKTAEIRKKAPVTIFVDNTKLQGRYHLVTQQVQAAADVQIDKTFDDDILVTSFGQKLLPMQLTCIALPDGLCDGAAEGSDGISEDSLAAMYKNRHAGRKGSGNKVTKIAVVFDKVTFEGILMSLSQVPHNLSNGASIDIFRYTLSIMGNFL
jgi:hypothetical protein